MCCGLRWMWCYTSSPFWLVTQYILKTWYVTLHWKKWFLHALPVLSGSYSFSCQISQASVNLPKHHLQEKERELWFVFACTLAALLSHVRLACLLNITSLQRSNMKLLCDTTGFVLKQPNIHAGFCNNEVAAVPQPWTLLCSCLFQILSQWELSPVVRWAPPFCCLCFYWRWPSSSTANAKAVSARRCSRVCVCVSISLPFIHYLSFYLSSQIAFNSNEINEYSYSMANCLKTPTVCFPLQSTDM